MRKLIYTTLLLLLVASLSYAQFGIRGGLSAATITGDDKAIGGVDPTTRTGFTGGLTYNIGLILGLSIEPGVSYVQGGTVYEAGIVKVTQMMDYIHIPVVVKFKLPIPLVSPYVEGGVSYGILLSAKTKIEITGLPTTETDVKDQMNKSDFGLVLGAGAEVLIFDVNARLYLGQSKLDKDGNAKIYARAIMVTAGIRF